jgi:hypothetical protein
VQQAVCGTLAEGRVLDVFAEYARALLFSASEQASALVRMGLRLVLIFPVVETVWHRFPP